MRKTLTEIGVEHGTDKATYHGYTEIYERYVSHLRDRKVNLLELGWGGHEDPDAGGASARMWREYFPQANVVIVENQPKNGDTIPDDISFWLGSQDDAVMAGQIARSFGRFHVIVDDASHVSSLTIASFKLWWPHLAPGGIYVVEDTHGAYHSHYYGDNEANMDPDAPTASGQPTSMQFLRRLADEVNFKGRDEDEFDLFPRAYSQELNVASVHFYFNLCIVIKGM